jgi:hypothetical protein
LSRFSRSITAIALKEGVRVAMAGCSICQEP